MPSAVTAGPAVLSSRREAEDGIRPLEGLRNDLAHAQDVVSANWDAIVLLSGHLDRALDDRGA